MMVITPQIYVHSIRCNPLIFVYLAFHAAAAISVKPIYPLNHAAETQSALIQWINGFDKKQAGGHWSPLSEITQFPRILTQNPLQYDLAHGQSARPASTFDPTFTGITIL
jgi:hypothetical protein